MTTHEPITTSDEEIHRKVMHLGFSEVVAALTGVLGERLVAFISNVAETRAVREWASGDRPVRQRSTVEPRLRLALQTALMLAEHDSPAVVQAWFQGSNPQLDDRVPATVLREGDFSQTAPDILAAARAFLAGG